MSVTTITPSDLAEKHKRGEALELIDVRTPVEYRELHCPFAKNVPLTELDPAKLIAACNGRPIYVICRSGSRGHSACEKLLAAGCATVANVEGGTLAWAATGLPVTRGAKAMSLERQVRIVAGLLILLGIGLSLMVHPYLLGLSAFVGAGLVFAGITDTCGMGMILARMPWNQVGAACSTPTGVIAKS